MRRFRSANEDAVWRADVGIGPYKMDFHNKKTVLQHSSTVYFRL
jgi:hypothetical protein